LKPRAETQSEAQRDPTTGMPGTGEAPDGLRPFAKRSRRHWRAYGDTEIGRSCLLARRLVSTAPAGTGLLRNSNPGTITSIMVTSPGLRRGCGGCLADQDLKDRDMLKDTWSWVGTESDALRLSRTFNHKGAFRPDHNSYGYSITLPEAGLRVGRPTAQPTTSDIGRPVKPGFIPMT